ncbi:hypothetical protein KY285_034389 [Solanum tuberosum]|nr:hypothetical protein KY285_034389 [Solanum tuberosum]
MLDMHIKLHMHQMSNAGCEDGGRSPQDAVTPFQILGGEAQIVQIMLKPQERIIAKPGSMCYMSGSIQMENVCATENEAGFWQWLFGKNTTSIVLHNTVSMCMLVCITPEIGEKIFFVLAIDLAKFGGEMLCQAQWFRLGTFMLEVSSSKPLASKSKGFTYWVKLVALGAVRVTFHLWFARYCIGARVLPYGHPKVVQKNLEVGEALAVDVPSIVALSSTVNVQVKYNGPMRRVVFGNDNLVTAVLTGPGIVFIQSMPFHRLSQRIARAVTSPNMRDNPKFFIQIAIFFFLAYVVVVSSLILTDI